MAIEPDGVISSFIEKPKGDKAWINGGFFVMEPGVFAYLPNNNACILEREPFEKLTGEGQIAAFKHEGFWKSMDTLKDKNELTNMWTKGKAPWALW